MPEKAGAARRLFSMLDYRAHKLFWRMSLAFKGERITVDANDPRRLTGGRLGYSRLPSDIALHRKWLRIGIDLGDVIIEGDDIYGDSVNIAARLEGAPVTYPKIRAPLLFLDPFPCYRRPKKKGPCRMGPWERNACQPQTGQALIKPVRFSSDWLNHTTA
jgi:hypothetical protein